MARSVDVVNDVGGLDVHDETGIRMHTNAYICIRMHTYSHTNAYEYKRLRVNTSARIPVNAGVSESS